MATHWWSEREEAAGRGVPRWLALSIPMLLLAAGPAAAQSIYTQCPASGIGENGGPARCFQVSAGDGFATMADGNRQYMFGFGDMNGVPDAQVMDRGTLAAMLPSPTLVVNQYDEVYLTVSNVGMAMRPDLFDPHTIHWHGFPDASSIFDGVPDSSISIGMGASLTYYYNVRQAGTYIYHCHVEATEHMQMGMYGNLYVKSAQDELPAGTVLSGFIHQTGYQYAYEDGDGSTYYDKDFPVLIHAFDPAFHDASETVAPLPFADMEDRYYMINGRGYPDTVDSAENGPLTDGSLADGNGDGTVGDAQRVSSLITGQVGQRILLRISSLNITGIDTVATVGIPMLVVGKDAKLLRNADGDNLYYQTQSLTLGGGETFDAILDLTGVQPGTYFLYSANQHRLTNDEPDLAGFQTGGMLTEIEVTP